MQNKISAAIMILDIGIGLLLLLVWTGEKQGREARTSASGKVLKEQTEDALTEKVPAGEVQSEETERKVSITFDDGPHPSYTVQLLDGLKERNVHATFFVTGEHAQANPDIIRRMKEEGHLIGNHTYSHMQLQKNNREKFKEELVATNEVIEQITGEEVEYVRPPYGSWDKSFEKELNMFPVLWTVDPMDWCCSSAPCIARKVLEKTEENDIILLHDYYESSVTAALKIIDNLLEQGYTFVTVDEILFD